MGPPVSEGLPEEQARQEARRMFGNYSLRKEETRGMNMTLWIDELRGNIGYGLRQLS